jgi:hypothetical protein
VIVDDEEPAAERPPGEGECIRGEQEGRKPGTGHVSG